MEDEEVFGLTSIVALRTTKVEEVIETPDIPWIYRFVLILVLHDSEKMKQKKKCINTRVYLSYVLSEISNANDKIKFPDGSSHVQLI